MLIKCISDQTSEDLDHCETMGLCLVGYCMVFGDLLFLADEIYNNECTLHYIKISCVIVRRGEMRLWVTFQRIGKH